MKNILALFATCLTLLGNQSQQVFNINNKPLDYAKTLCVKQFDPSKGTLTRVEIQAEWEVDTEGDYEVDLDLGCVTDQGPGTISNTLTQDSTGHWNLAVGIDTGTPGLPLYVGTGKLQFQASFDAVSLSGPATGSLRLTVTYTYDP